MDGVRGKGREGKGGTYGTRGHIGEMAVGGGGDGEGEGEEVGWSELHGCCSLEASRLLCPAIDGILQC